MTTSKHHQQALPPVPSHSPAAGSNSVRRTPRTAVLSLLCGLLAFFTLLFFVGVFFALIAIISGHLALNRIRHSSGRLAGDGLAMAGVVMGYLVLIATSFMLLVLTISYQPIRQRIDLYQQQQSEQYASRLYLAAESYARDHRGAFPKQWSDLKGRHLSSPDLDSYLDSTHSFQKQEDPAFKLVPHQRPVLPAASSQVVVIQEIAPPHVPLVIIVYANGDTELISNPDRDFDR